MCITKDCDNPTLPGVWWQEDDQWCLYSEAHQQKIKDALNVGLQSVDLGMIRSGVHPNGRRYVVDLAAMEQKALPTGFTRSFFVIDPLTTLTTQQLSRMLRQPSTGGAQNRQSSLQFHYRNSGGSLVRYGSNVSQALSNAIYCGRTHCFVPNDSTSHFYFDLKGMVQLVAVLSDGCFIFSQAKPITFSVGVSWSPSDIVTRAVGGEKYWRRKILEMVANEYGNDSHLEEILKKMAPSKAVVSFKRAAWNPGEVAYENFLESLDEAFTKCDAKSLEIFVKNMQDGCLESDNGFLQIAFKPTLSSDRKVDPSATMKEDSVVFWKCIMSALAAETLDAAKMRCK